MKANELRIGNLAEYHIEDELDERKEWWEVITIDSDDINWLEKEEPETIDYRPITLTEEWLLKFGFESIENSGFFRKYYNDKYYLLYNPKQQYTEICVNSICGGQSKTKYIHQIQNLYFALTGTELEIKKTS